MPKPFTEAERELIHRRLLAAGQECWERYGIRRTNIEDLTKRAGIAKGTFYSFFASKELLFMAVLEDRHEAIKRKLMGVILQEQGSPQERFVAAVMRIYEEVRQSPWLVSLMSGKGEYDYLVRKLPPEKLEQHILGDDADTRQLFTLLGVSEEIRPELVSAALRGIFVMLLHVEEVGEEEIDATFRLLIEGLAMRIFAG